VSEAGAKMTFKKGQAKGMKFALVQALFNQGYTSPLANHAAARLRHLGALPKDILSSTVPGAFELPLAAKELAGTNLYDAVICIGAVIRGETNHYDLVCESAASGILRAGMDTGVPVIFGVITCDTLEQARERCDGGPKDAGIHAAEAAIHMASLLQRIRRGN
jgi:6,7-dimethyl-8-ribityllumazine synthase